MTIAPSITAFQPIDTAIHGNCIEIMSHMSPASIDMILTDPPYITRYRSRDGQTVRNDDNDRWLKPAFAEAYRTLKPGGFCISFYGWNRADTFLGAWRSAGFRPVGHIIFRKRYASGGRFLRYHHEQAYLLAKGRVDLPAIPIPDVIDWRFEGNALHPTQKPVSILTPLIEAFSNPARSFSIPSAVPVRRSLPPTILAAGSSASNSKRRTTRRQAAGFRRTEILAWPPRRPSAPCRWRQRNGSPPSALPSEPARPTMSRRGAAAYSGSIEDRAATAVP